MIDRGIADAHAGRVTADSLLLALAATRLRRAGVQFPPLPGVEHPEAALYELLAETEGENAHSAYNARTRLLVSYLDAAERSAPPR